MHLSICCHLHTSFHFMRYPCEFSFSLATDLVPVWYTHTHTQKRMFTLILMQAFNGKKWEKFNSEKVATLAYGRIQGKAALVTHFQNSSLMNEDKRCRPILFISESSEAGDQVEQ